MNLMNHSSMPTNNQYINNVNMQPQATQGYQQALQISSSNNFSQPAAMAEYSFFYKTYNDSQIYHIICKEITFYDCLSFQNHVQPSNTHVFYYQQPYDKKIYQIICEVVSYNFVVYLLNKINYGIELNFNHQENPDFSSCRKENLELHLKQDLINFI